MNRRCDKKKLNSDHDRACPATAGACFDRPVTNRTNQHIYFKFSRIAIDIMTECKTTRSLT